MLEQRRTLTVEQASLVLGVSRSVAYAGVRNGSIPSIRLGRRIVIPRARLFELLGENPAPSNASDPGGSGSLADDSTAFEALRRDRE